MIGAFLRNQDGGFEYGPAFGALLFASLAALNIWILYGALTRRRIPFGFSGTYFQSKIFWFDRGKNPAWYWFAFAAYSSMIPFYVWTAYALCTGVFHKAD